MSSSRNFSQPSASIVAKGAALVAGTLFGAGLVISGMTNPDKVIAFLRLDEHWDPSLIFVMGSALIVTSTGYFLANKKSAPLFDTAFHSPVAQTVDKRLLGGSALFGMGWAIAGYCPGPAIVGAFLVDTRALLFLASYLVGVGIFETTRASTAVALADG